MNNELPIPSFTSLMVNTLVSGKHDDVAWTAARSLIHDHLRNLSKCPALLSAMKIEIEKGQSRFRNRDGLDNLLNEVDCVLRAMEDNEEFIRRVCEDIQ